MALKVMAPFSTINEKEEIFKKRGDTTPVLLATTFDAAAVFTTLSASLSREVVVLAPPNGVL